MGFSFRPAVREGVGLLIGLAGPSGSGKTYSALRLAKGIAGERPFAVIDTEAGRAKHYADRFRFDHGDLKPPFRPDAYLEAIAAADAAGYPVITVDSTSHEYAGDGGLLDWHEDELERLAGSDYRKREAVKMAAWIKPKMSHKQMVQRLLQIRAHLILCFRAEPKIEMVRDADGKMQIVEKKSLTGLHGWIPVTEKNLPYELTVSFLLLPDRPGVPLPIKLQEQHRALFPLDAPITEESGARLAAWAQGGTTPLETAAPASRPSEDWDTLIAQAATKAELAAITRRIKALKKGTLSPDELERLRAAYVARQAEVTAAAAPATPAANQGEKPEVEASQINWGPRE